MLNVHTHTQVRHTHEINFVRGLKITDEFFFFLNMTKNLRKCYTLCTRIIEIWERMLLCQWSAKQKLESFSSEETEYSGVDTTTIGRREENEPTFPTVRDLRKRDNQSVGEPLITNSVYFDEIFTSEGHNSILW